MDEVRFRRPIRGVLGVMIGPRISGRLIFGLIAVTLGVLWTLDNLGLIDSSQVLRWWPTIILAIGVSKLLGFGTRPHLVWGMTFTVAGLLLLAGSLHLIHFGVEAMWPIALIFLGVQLVMRSSRVRAPDAGGDPMNTTSTFAFWSQIERKPVSQEFRGGDISAVMGGSRLDLRGAKAAPEGAVVDLFVWWGGVEIILSENWRVVNESNVVMGGIEDKTKTPPADARDTLILRGLIVMGGIELKN